MRNKLVLIGGGGHCKSVIDAVKRSKIFEKIVITDPAIAVGTSILGVEVVGTDDSLERLRYDGFKYAFITVGSIGLNPLRERLVDKAFSLGFRFPIIIDSSATISDSAVIGEGTFIGKNAVINADTEIEKHCIINTGAIIEHGCKIGEYSHISVGTILCGEVEVGINSFIGAGSSVIHCLHIGNNAVIGAGAVVNKNIPANCIAVGIPAKVIKENGKE